MKLSFAKKIGLLASCILFKTAYAQPGTTIDLEKQKPEKYKEKLLKSEKTEEKKIRAIKHFFSNTVSHYNYYYNANVKLGEILEKAKESFVDDYTTLLPFYNYSLNTTATDKNIDSVIFKTNSGILLHDLRSDWVDDLYMMLGKAYLYRKDFDSAHYVFQYLNYIYAAKDDGYDIPMGSNITNEDGIFTVSTNEKKRPFIQKVILRKPLERNGTFIWMIRNYLENKKYGEAIGLISILNNDVYFPKRLKTDLNEVTAYYYYLQQQYDSAAFHLEKSLSNAETKEEKGRWEFLCGQMYQRIGLYDEANKLFKKAIKHSSNPLVDVYARLSMIGGYGDTNNIKNKNAPVANIEALTKMAKRERYADYRDIIYYAAGKVSWQQKDRKAAVDFFLKSATTSVDNLKQKNLSFLALADAEYFLKEYKPAASHYDSVNIRYIDSVDIARVVARKPALKIIAKNMDAIYLQDSLQVLAKLPSKELKDVLKKIYRQYKKNKGAKETDESFDFGSDNATTNPTATFTSVETKPGEFYFANIALKAQGSKDFKARWGNRPNVDNWNRAAAVSNKIDTDKKSNAEKDLLDKQASIKKQSTKTKQDANNSIIDDNNPMTLGNPDLVDTDNTNDKIKSIKKTEPKEDVEVKNDTVEVTPESLFEAIPLSAEKIQSSNNVIIDALFQNAIVFSNKLDDYPSAIAAYEELLRRFPKNKHTEQALFNLAFCYKQVNKTDKATALEQRLETEFPNGTLIRIIKEKTSTPFEDSATIQYTAIYNLFLEGKYEQATTAKKNADSIYKQQYWNPQLSFIESVYYIKQKQDSTAINRLETIVKGKADKALQDKAARMIEILKQRKQIEEYLSNLDSNGHYDSALAKMNAAMRDSMAMANLLKEKERQNVLKIDSSLIGKEFKYNPNEPHFAVLLLDKVDDVFIKETITSINKYNKEKLINTALNVSSLKLNEQYNLILIGTLSNAPNGLSYIDDIKPETVKILPWLPTFKYTYSLIGISNLEVLKANNNMDTYKAFLKKTFVGRF